MAQEGPGWPSLPFSAPWYWWQAALLPSSLCPDPIHLLAIYFSHLFSILCPFTHLFKRLFFYFSVFRLVSFLLCSLKFLSHPTENCFIWGRGTCWSMFSSVIWLTRVTVTGEGSTKVSVQKCDPTWYGNCAFGVMSDVRQEEVDLSWFLWFSLTMPIICGFCPFGWVLHTLQDSQVEQHLRFLYHSPCGNEIFYSFKTCSWRLTCISRWSFILQTFENEKDIDSYRD